MVAAGSSRSRIRACPPRSPKPSAQRSEAVGAHLAAGEPCAATAEAQSLEEAIAEAIAVGRVPVALRPELVRTARTLREAIRCDEGAGQAASVEGEAGDGAALRERATPTADRCARLEQELAAVEEEEKALDERRRELGRERKHDKEERKRQQEALKREREALDGRRHALREELRACEEAGL